MSQIPFVNQLGDSIEAAITASSVRTRVRRRGPRRLLVAIAALLTLGGSVALAGILSSPTDLAMSSVGCYETADRSGATIIILAGDRSPAEACTQTLHKLGRPVGELATCDNGRGAVVVFPGSGAMACRRAGLKSLPAQYDAEQTRVRALERALIALESSAECIPPHELAGRVQTLLQRSGWTGWRPWLRLDITSGPCGSVSELGLGSRAIIGFDSGGRRVMVFAGPDSSARP